MSVIGPASAIARAAFIVATLAVAALILIGSADTVMRVVGSPIAGALESLELAATIAVALGAPAAVYLYRDPRIPASPAWLGRGGTGLALLVCAAFAAAVTYFLVVGIGGKLGGERSMELRLPTLAITIYALAACFALLLALALAFAAGLRDLGPGAAPLPWAIALGIAALLLWAAAAGLGNVGTLFAMRLTGFTTAVSGFATPVVVAALFGGAIAAVRPVTRISAVAAPLGALVLVAMMGDVSIMQTAIALAAPALAMGVLHAAFGHWRGWAATADDAIGLGLIVLCAMFLVSGAFTPSELTSLFGLLGIGVLALVAALLRKPNLSLSLARGLGHGLGILFAFLMILMLTDAFARLDIMQSLPSLLEGALAIVLCLGIGISLGAVLGATAGSALTAFVLFTLAGKAIEPGLIACVAVLASLAGGALQPWLSWRLAGGTPPPGTPSFGAAVLAAVPPALLAVAIWFVPGLILAPIRALNL